MVLYQNGKEDLVSRVRAESWQRDYALTARWKS
jgi:hypothetical protein